MKPEGTPGTLVDVIVVGCKAPLIYRPGGVYPCSACGKQWTQAGAAAHPQKASSAE